jgi:hypothetical protein
VNPRHRRIARARRAARDRVAAFRREAVAKSRQQAARLQTHALVICRRVPVGRSQVELAVGDEPRLLSHLTVDAQYLVIRSVTERASGAETPLEHLTQPIQSHHFRLGFASSPPGTVYTLTVDAQEAQEITVQLRGLVMRDHVPSRRSLKRAQQAMRKLVQSLKRSGWPPHGIRVARASASASVPMSRPK